MITSNRSYVDPDQRYPLQETWKGATVRRVPTAGFGRMSRAGRLADYASFLAGAAARLLKGPSPDVIVGLSTPPILGALAVAVARLRRSRTVYWVMDVYPDLAIRLGVLGSGGVASRILKAVSRWTLERADMVVALGPLMGETLRRNGASHLTVISNWADGEAIVPKPVEESRYRTSCGWADRFVVLYSGNLGLVHDVETVLGAADRLRHEKDILFAFIGHGPRLQEVTDTVRERGLTNVEVHRPVPRGDLGDVLASGDVHLVTLHEDVAGLVVPSKLYGILAAGRPVVYVGPEAGEAFETVGRGCGDAVKNGNEEHLARILREYREAPARRLERGQKARELFDAEFSKSHQTHRFAEMVSSVSAVQRD